MGQPRRQHRRHPILTLDRLPELPYLAVTGILLVATWLLVQGLDQQPTVWNHLYYIPIVLAAVRFGVLAGAGTALAAGLLAGPLGGDLDPEVVLPRGALFLVIGVIVGLLASARVEALRREHEVAERESALIAQRASLMQLVSHEFRTPLTIIRGTLETLAGRTGVVASPFHELVQATERHVDRLQEMVDVVLAAADELDTGSTPHVCVDVAALVRHAAESLRADLLERIRIDVPPGAIVVTVEPYLWLALRCLLDNAAKFSPDDERIVVQYVARTRTVEISVIDRGPGLPAGFERLAFEPFTQADPSERRSHQGLGMGLYTARRLARRLGGDLTVASGPGQGVTATLVIPQRRADDAQARPRPVTVDASSAARSVRRSS